MWYARRLSHFEAKIDKDASAAVRLFGVAAYIGVDDFHDAKTNGQAVAPSLRAVAARLLRWACRYDRLGAVERVAGPRKHWQPGVSERARAEASYALSIADAAEEGDVAQIHRIIVARTDASDD